LNDKEHPLVGSTGMHHKTLQEERRPVLRNGV
jgi:hypothetical protein